MLRIIDNHSHFIRRRLQSGRLAIYLKAILVIKLSGTRDRGRGGRRMIHEGADGMGADDTFNINTSGPTERGLGQKQVRQTAEILMIGGGFRRV